MEAKASTLRVDVNQVERVRRHATRLVGGLRHVLYEERLHHLSMFSLERRRLRAYLILACKFFIDEVGPNPSDLNPTALNPTTKQEPGC